MTSEGDFDLQRDGAWLSAYVDAELAGPDVVRVEGWLATHADARVEVARLRELKDLTASFALRDAPAESWETFWTAPVRRLERRVGWVLLAAGALVLGGSLAWRAVAALWQAAHTPLVLKVAVLAVVAGVALLLVSIVRERLYTRARTRYKDVVR